LSQRRVVAVGLIVAEDGRLLLQHREARAGVPGAGRWGFFGGHLEQGERPQHAFLREMQEELGWRPRHFEHFLTRDIDAPGWHVTSHAFAAHLDVPVGVLTLGEGQAMALFAPDALPQETTPSVPPVITEFVASDAYRRVMHRWETICVTALLVDPSGRFLLQHRDNRPGIDNPGRWGSFGGAIDRYETPLDGLLRELREEIGWAPARASLFDAFPYRNGDVLVYAYAAALDVPRAALTLSEGQGMDLFAPGDLPEETVPYLRDLILRFARSDDYAQLVGPRET
jgi:8-oxo-dGTP pyrophosphatase MutT (NUDIX family)